MVPTCSDVHWDIRHIQFFIQCEFEFDSNILKKMAVSLMRDFPDQTNEGTDTVSYFISLI